MSSARQKVSQNGDGYISASGCCKGVKRSNILIKRGSNVHIYRLYMYARLVLVFYSSAVSRSFLRSRQNNIIPLGQQKVCWHKGMPTYFCLACRNTISEMQACRHGVQLFLGISFLPTDGANINSSIVIQASRESI